MTVQIKPPDQIKPAEARATRGDLIVQPKFPIGTDTDALERYVEKKSSAAVWCLATGLARPR